MAVDSKTILDEMKDKFPLNNDNRKVLAELDEPGQFGPSDDDTFRRACYMVALRKANQQNKLLNANKILSGLGNIHGATKDEDLSVLADPATGDDKFNGYVKKFFNTKTWEPKAMPATSYNGPKPPAQKPSISATQSILDQLQNGLDSDMIGNDAEPEEPKAEEPKPAEVTKPAEVQKPAEEPKPEPAKPVDIPKEEPPKPVDVPKEAPKPEPKEELKPVPPEPEMANETESAPPTATVAPVELPSSSEGMLGNDTEPEDTDDEDDLDEEPSVPESDEEPASDGHIVPDMSNPAMTGTTKKVEEKPKQKPETPAKSTEDLRNEVYSAIDEMAMSEDQAEEAKSYADVILDDPDAHPREFAAIGDASKRGAVVAGLLRTANRVLGFKQEGKADDTIKFTGGKTAQSRTAGSVSSALVTPEGFGTKKATVLWNQPVITEFGFPFINFSSAALVNILKSKEDNEIKNDQLKQMFKDAKKKYGGVWKAIYAAPLSLIKQIASDPGTQCTPCYLKVDGNELIEAEQGGDVTVTPIQYYSVDASYDDPVSVPRDFISNFYDIIDYSTSSKRTYLKYAYGMTADDFAEAIDDNGGVPPFYILVPKKAAFSRCDVRPGSLFGSLLNIILGRRPCTLVKAMFEGKRGCLVIDEEIADSLFADV